MATDYFLKIDGIEGESTDDRHRGEIEVDAWSFGGAQSATLQPYRQRIAWIKKL